MVVTPREPPRVAVRVAGPPSLTTINVPIAAHSQLGGLRIGNRQTDALECDLFVGRLVAELAAVAGDRPMQWVMLDDVMRALGATWEEAEQAADFAAAQVWVEHRMHSLLLREPGRNVLNRERRP